MNKNYTGAVALLLTVLTVELVRRNGLHPLSTLSGAASGALVLA